MALHEVDVWNRALSRVGDARITLEASKTISAATAANPVVCTVTSHGYATGDLILIREMDEMTEVNARVFQITKVDANSFSLDEEDGTSYTAESTGGKAFRLLAGTRSLRTGAKTCFDAWENVRDEVLETHPWTNCTKRSRGARLQAAKTVTGATQANPVVITSAAHGYSLGDEVLIESVVGMTELNDRWFVVGNTTTNTFELSAEDGTDYTAYSSGGTAKKAGTPFTPDSGYDNRYTLPADSLRVLELVDSTEQWMVENGELHTDVGDTAPIRYIFRQKDVTQYRPALVNSLAFRLALELMEELTQSNTKRERAFQEYEHFLARSQMLDSQEQSPKTWIEDPWLTSRL